MDARGQTLGERVGKFGALRVFQYKDFRWLWIGAFLSFTGSVIQGVAQQDLVFAITQSPAKLAMVSFAMMAPVSLLGPILGVVADMFDKRRLLVLCMVISAIGPLALGWAGHLHILQYWMFVVTSLVSGFVQCVEVPTRQSVIRCVVADRDLAAAIPVQASTFNMARVIGPPIGGLVALKLGAETCFVLNGLSFFALAFAALAIKANLKPLTQRVEPVKDLVLEGFRYTFRTRALRTLFILESATAVFGTFFISQMSALAQKHLGLDPKTGTAACFTAFGVGALFGLFSTATLSGRPLKPFLVRFAMTGMAFGVIALGLVRTEWAALGILATLGAFSIMQFNTTNTLFQLIAPPALRGRVISMHVWAIAGVAPVGVLLFGNIAEWLGIGTSLMIAGACLAFFAAWGWTQKQHVTEPAALA